MEDINETLERIDKHEKTLNHIRLLISMVDYVSKIPENPTKAEKLIILVKLKDMSAKIDNSMNEYGKLPLTISYVTLVESFIKLIESDHNFSKFHKMLLSKDKEMVELGKNMLYEERNEL